jgi:hypothetical protein
LPIFDQGGVVDIERHASESAALQFDPARVRANPSTIRYFSNSAMARIITIIALPRVPPVLMASRTVLENKVRSPDEQSSGIILCKSKVRVGEIAKPGGDPPGSAF